MEHLRQQALGEAIHYCNIKATDLEQDMTSDQVVKVAEKFYAFLSGTAEVERSANA